MDYPATVYAKNRNLLLLANGAIPDPMVSLALVANELRHVQVLAPPEKPAFTSLLAEPLEIMLRKLITDIGYYNPSHLSRVDNQFIALTSNSCKTNYKPKQHADINLQSFVSIRLLR